MEKEEARGPTARQNRSPLGDRHGSEVNDTTAASCPSLPPRGPLFWWPIRSCFVFSAGPAPCFPGLTQTTATPLRCHVAPSKRRSALPLAFMSHRRAPFCFLHECCSCSFCFITFGVLWCVRGRLCGSMMAAWRHAVMGTGSRLGPVRVPGPRAP